MQTLEVFYQQQQIGRYNRTKEEQRPDIVLWSALTRQVAMLELTVSWKERLEEAHKRKKLKY